MLLLVFEVGLLYVEFLLQPSQFLLAGRMVLVIIPLQLQKMLLGLQQFSLLKQLSFRLSLLQDSHPLPA